MDDCAPNGGEREITARRRRRGERGCTTMISFFPRFFWGNLPTNSVVVYIKFGLDILASQIYFCMCTFATLLFVMVFFCSSNGIWKCICGIIISPSSIVDINNKWYVTSWPCHSH